MRSGNADHPYDVGRNAENLTLSVMEHAKWDNTKGNGSAPYKSDHFLHPEVTRLNAEVEIVKEKLRQCELDREHVVSQLDETVRTVQVGKILQTWNP